jgi:hypothetical protein
MGLKGGALAARELRMGGSRWEGDGHKYGARAKPW